MNPIYNTNFSENEYLDFLSKSVSPKLKDILRAYGDFEIDKSLSIDDILNPLESKQFPRSNLKEFNWYLGEIITGISLNSASHDPNDLVYICSFYIFAQLKFQAGIELLPVATALMIKSCRNSKPLRIHCVRYFLWMMSQEDIDQRDFNSLVYLNLSVISLTAYDLHDLSKVLTNLYTKELALNPDMHSILDDCVSDCAINVWRDIATDLCKRSGLLDETSNSLARVIGIQP